MTKEQEAGQEETPIIDIHTAMLAVYERIGYVPKKGRIESGTIKYKFAGEADFIAAIRPAMIEAGIYQSPLKMDVLTNERLESVRSFYDKDAKAYKDTKVYQHRVVIHVDYKFQHAASQTHIVVPAFGEAMDSGDKAFNKAMTAANKYALRQAFMIETGDDPDKYPSKPEGGVDDKPGEEPKRKTARARNAEYNALKADLEAAHDASSLRHTWETNKEAILAYKDSMGQEYYDQLVNAKEKRKKELADKELEEAGFPQDMINTPTREDS